MMRIAAAVLCFACFASAQTAPPSGAMPPINDLQQTAQALNADLLHLRIDKWKTDGGTKQQAQEMASSVSRNVTAALPELLQAARTQPASLAAQFKLYHNLTALYETMASLTETAGAFGPRQEYDALSSDANRLDAQRRALANYVQTLATQSDSEIARFHSMQAQAAAAAASAPPKKIIVDDDTTTKKPATSTRKKASSTTKKPATAPAQQPPQ